MGRKKLNNIGVEMSLSVLFICSRIGRIHRIVHAGRYGHHLHPVNLERRSMFKVLAVIGFSIWTVSYFLSLKIIEHEKVREWQFAFIRIPTMWHFAIYLVIAINIIVWF